jgi:hypothetical protein
MSKASAQIIAVKPRGPAPSLTGFIDAITADRIFGWTWDPQRPQVRIAVRAEVDGKQTAAAIADQPREDLASNNVGDGAHAFEISITPGTTPERIRVFAVDPENGECLELGHRPIEGALPTVERAEELRGVVHALCRSQRLLSGKVQSALDAIEALHQDEEVKVGHDEVASRLEALEIAIARIDGALRDQGSIIDALKRHPQDHISRILACAGAGLGAAALLISVIR